MEKLLQEIEKIESVCEDDISSKFKTLIPDNGDEISLELKGELIAFDLVENYSGDNSVWGTYFGPRLIWRNDDGSTTEAPSIQHIDKDMIDYWLRRLDMTKNPLLKARYSGLIWDFSQPILHLKPEFKIGIIYIESLIETVEKRIHRYTTELITKITRALNVACSLNAQELITKAKDTILILENELGENDKPGLWGFSYDLLINNKKIQLSSDETDNIIKKLELRFTELIDLSQLNPWNAEAAAVRLANYFRKKGEIPKVQQIILSLGKAYEQHEEKSDAMHISSSLQHIHQIYLNYGLYEEAKEILIKIREIGHKIINEMAPISTTFKFPKEEFDQYIDLITEGEPNIVLHKIIQHFIPKKEAVKERMFEFAKKSPLTYLISTNIHDSKGRVVAKIGSLEDDVDGRLMHEIAQSISFNAIFIRHVFYKLRENNIVNSNDILEFIGESVIIDKSRLEIIRKGINAYFSEDLIVAIHLIIPQIEDAIRNLIEMNSGAVLKIPKHGSGYQLKTLDELLRDEIITNVLGEDIQIYLRVLLTDQRGWNLRNDVCHGMSEIESFSYQSIERLIHVLLILGTLRKA